MIKKVALTGEIPEYHSSLLIVKMRPVVAGAGMSFAASPGASPSAMSNPGMSVLSTFERSGLIKRVVPLSQRGRTESDSSGLLRPLTTLAMSAERSTPDDPQSGVNIIEMERDEDVAHLREALAADPTVEFVSRVPVRYLSVNTRASEKGGRRPGAKARPAQGGAVALAAPPPAATMWNLRKIQWAQARALQTFQEAVNVRVAVLDTGVDVNHPDLAGMVADYTYQYPGVLTPSGAKDIIGHGTHVAGTIGAAINNNIGINGICRCRLSAWKIFGDQTTFASWQDGFVYYVEPVMYRRALADCLDEGVDVINLSIGGPGKPDPQERQLFNSLLANGTTVVAAMGNEREIGSPTSYPAAIPGVIAVGATGADDTVAKFSNRGSHISLCAPGAGIWSTLPTYPGQTGFQAVPGPGGSPREGKPFRRETDYDSWDGTSMASPHVAAAAALLIAKHGNLSPSDVRGYLTQTADKVAGMSGASFSQDYGHGRLNLLSLLS
ncbi:MAG TPA: S8 family serine peptidase [Pyrinomonadaceae bacterium]|jgi:subtilisin family serine protease